MNRCRAACGLRKRAMKLELKNEREEVSRVWDVSGHVILGARIKELVAAGRDWSDALILQSKFPPRFVVILGFNFAGKDFPPPLIDEQAKRQKCNLLERPAEQKSDVARSIGRFIDQTDLDEIFGRNRQRNGVADCFVEPVVRAIAEDDGQIFVSALIEVVAQFVVDRSKIFVCGHDAHLDP